MRLLGLAPADLAPDQPREAEVETVPEHRFPRPSEVAQADDMWARMLEICPREHHPVLILKREGLPLTEIAIYPRTTGYLKRWTADVGDRVNAGQLLAEIATPEIDAEL